MYRAGKFASTFDKKVPCLKLPYRRNATRLVVLTGNHLALEGSLTPELVETWLRNTRTTSACPSL